LEIIADRNIICGSLAGTKSVRFGILRIKSSTINNRMKKKKRENINWQGPLTTIQNNNNWILIIWREKLSIQSDRAPLWLNRIKPSLKVFSLADSTDDAAMSLPLSWRHSFSPCGQKKKILTKWTSAGP
jgi:hypothetical protein